MEGPGGLQDLERLEQTSVPVDKAAGERVPDAHPPGDAETTAARTNGDAKTNGATPNGAAREGAPDAVLGDGQIRDVFQNERGVAVHIERSRDDLLTVFGKATLSDRYLMNGESFQDLFARVAAHFADDSAHAQRLYDYISRLWLMPATPVLSNGGTTRGLPVGCRVGRLPVML